MSEFPGNSQRRRPAVREEKAPEPAARKIERVVEVDIVRRKPSLGKRIRDAFLGGSDRSLLEFVAQDVIIPSIQNMAYESVVQGAGRAFFGESGAGRARPGDPRRAGGVNYAAISRATAASRDAQAGLSRRARQQHIFDEIILPTKGDADTVLEGLYGILEEYDTVSVSDLYELIGESGQFTDRNWGWTDLFGSNVRRVRDGWLLELPRTVSLNR